MLQSLLQIIYNVGKYVCCFICTAFLHTRRRETRYVYYRYESVIQFPNPFLSFQKWRKRYFVLRMPPAASSLPGSCGLLEYYDSPRCTKRKGSIDLDQCEEVTLSLDTYDYNHLFALSSKHKGRNRTYYLAAENEDTMNHWVECLCKVCGFKPDDEHNTGEQREMP